MAKRGLTKEQLIAEIHKLRRPGDPLIPCGKSELVKRLDDLKERAKQLLEEKDEQRNNEVL